MSKNASPFCIPCRPRRLRRTAAIRSLTQETWLRPENLVQPLFVLDGEGKPTDIDAMPGIQRLPIEYLLKECEAILKAGIKAVILFPNVLASLKNPMGDEALNPNGLIIRAVKALKKEFPELTVMTDIALDPYTTHGHDGVLTANGSDVDNDRTLEILQKMAVLQAQAGVDMVAPSDMMDGRVGVIRGTLDNAGYIDTGILAYTAKYNSGFYGPFREAVGSASSATMGATLSKKTYQMSSTNRREALREAELDESECADILMVKPAGPYLDVIRDLRLITTLPIAAYQVSGEYSQILAAAQKGWLDKDRCREESLMAIKRAGADIILTYFAKEQAASL